MAGERTAENPSDKPWQHITWLSVSGYKSIYEECKIGFRSLTILAGANSSGKSSAIQPLLLLKQTLDAPYDPGPLLLDGDHVRFTKADQFLSRVTGKPPNKTLQVGIGLAPDPPESPGSRLRLTFAHEAGRGMALHQMDWSDGTEQVVLDPAMPSDVLKDAHSYLEDVSRALGSPPFDVAISRDRCFFRIDFSKRTGLSTGSSTLVFYMAFAQAIRHVLHVPATRGNPERTYPRADISSRPFKGTFLHYFASVVADWQATGDGRLDGLCKDMSDLGLTHKVDARLIDETQVELRVNRLPLPAKDGSVDMVSTSDVGVGVPQVLPVAVALLAADPGELVYVDEPELHLHPRAIFPLAGLLANAALRGVRVVVETQSSPLLLAVQTLVAEGRLAPDLLRLYWFQRDENGATEATPGELDEAGAFGDWPEDFDSLELEAQSRYMDAAEQRLMAGK